MVCISPEIRQENAVQIERHGIILNVEKFDDCVRFYKTLFELPEEFSKTEGDFRLTCLTFGSAYLMIETGGVSCSTEKSSEQTATILRFNVNDIEQTYQSVLNHDNNARLIKNDWGTIVRCTDPDGNPISIRESAGFVPEP